MRTVIFTAFLLLTSLAGAQPALRATQLTEFADGLAQPHDAAFSPDGKLIYLTDMANSRIRVLEAMTLKPVGSFGAGELSHPHDAEFDKSGRLLVADTGNDRVAIYEVKGAQARLMPTRSCPTGCWSSRPVRPRRRRLPRPRAAVFRQTPYPRPAAPP